MVEKAKELQELLQIFKDEFSGIDEELTSIKLSDDRWTLKEIIGHLVDSASNNHQRFVRMLISDNIDFPDYKTDEWLEVQKHNSMPYSDLLNLFIYFNKQLSVIISNVDKSKLQRKWNVAWNENTDFITLESLISHYISHVRGHLTHFRERLEEVKSYNI